MTFCLGLNLRKMPELRRIWNISLASCPNYVEEIRTHQWWERGRKKVIKTVFLIPNVFFQDTVNILAAEACEWMWRWLCNAIHMVQWMWTLIEEVNATDGNTEARPIAGTSWSSDETSHTWMDTSHSQLKCKKYGATWGSLSSLLENTVNLSFYLILRYHFSGEKKWNLIYQAIQRSLNQLWW